MSRANNSSVPAPRDPGTTGLPADAEVTLPLMSITSGPEGMPGMLGDGESGSKPGGRRVMNQGTLLILLVLAVAGAALYVMRVTQKDITGSGVDRATENKINDVLANPNSVNTGRDQELATRIDTLSGDPSKYQVALDYLKKNPFDAHQDKPVAVSDKEPVSWGPDRKPLEDELKTMRLNSVMRGATAAASIAVVNGEFYRVGQVVGSFTVTGVRESSIDLEAQGMSFRLSMEEEKKPGPR